MDSDCSTRVRFDHANGNSLQGPESSESTPSDYTLLELLKRIGQRCKGSFDRLYKLTSSRLNGVLLRMLRSPSDAEDALQESYLKVWRLAATFDESRGSAFNWLMAIARNCALDKMRRGATRPVAATVLSDDADPYAAIPSDDDHAVTRLARQRAFGQVQASLMQLHPMQRQCVVLAFFDGLSHSEIAAQVEHPLGTVKSWIRRAVERIRPDVTEYPGMTPAV